MRRSLAIAGSVALIVAMLVAPGAAGRATKTVDVGDDFFDPGKVTIKKKDRIAFNWIGENEHNVAKSDGPGKFWESDELSGSGVLFKRKFTKPGKYTLICTLHAGMDMRVKVKK
jgi:plastocyanin